MSSIPRSVMLAPEADVDFTCDICGAHPRWPVLAELVNTRIHSFHLDEMVGWWLLFSATPL